MSSFITKLPNISSSYLSKYREDPSVKFFLFLLVLEKISIIIGQYQTVRKPTPAKKQSKSETKKAPHKIHPNLIG